MTWTLLLWRNWLTNVKAAPYRELPRNVSGIKKLRNSALTRPSASKYFFSQQHNTPVGICNREFNWMLTMVLRNMLLEPCSCSCSCSCLLQVAWTLNTIRGSTCKKAQLLTLFVKFRRIYIFLYSMGHRIWTLLNSLNERMSV